MTVVSLVPLLLVLLALLLPYPPAVGAAVTVSYTVASSWNGGQQLALSFKNTGSAAVCSVTFSITFPSGTTITSSWNMESVGGSSTKYSLPTWANIAPGASFTSAGLNTAGGNGNPSLSVLSSTECGGGGSGTTTTTTTTTKPGQTTTTTKSGQTTTTTTQSSGGGATLVVKPVVTTKETCLSESSASGPSSAQLNKPITGGQFTFYGAGGNGACGYQASTPTMSAAASGTLFNTTQTWVPSCLLPDKPYLLNDPICMNKCVKILYKGKTLTVPINNKCPECPLDHVDLSEPAFLWLEPAGGTVGIAKGALDGTDHEALSQGGQQRSQCRGLGFIRDTDQLDQ